jgi:hypothetical protein
MIKDIKEIFNKSDNYIRKFILNCEISEKVAAFYFHVKIVSPTMIRIYKSNYQELRLEDIIINSMWQEPYTDMNRVFLSNTDFMKKYVGLTISFFYFPIYQPFHIKYNSPYKYIVGYVRDAKGNSYDTEYFANILSKISHSGIKGHDVIVIPKNTHKSSEDINELNKIIQSRSVRSLEKYIINMLKRAYKAMDQIDENHFVTKAVSGDGVEYAEGYILRYNGIDYQLNLYPMPKPEMPDNRLALEFFIHTFSMFLKSDEWIQYISSDYVQSVCNLFLGYIDNYFKIVSKSFTHYNITYKELEAPNFGYYPGTSFETIPSNRVRNLCKDNKLFDNIFKILLNGLKKKKKKYELSMLLSNEDIDQWNSCVEIIKKFTSTNLK